MGKGKFCSYQAISPFPRVLSTFFENFPLFSCNSKLSSANSFSWKNLKFVVWERVRALVDHNLNVAQLYIASQNI